MNGLSVPLDSRKVCIMLGFSNNSEYFWGVPLEHGLKPFAVYIGVSLCLENTM